MMVVGPPPRGSQCIWSGLYPAANPSMVSRLRATLPRMCRDTLVPARRNTVLEMFLCPIPQFTGKTSLRVVLWPPPPLLNGADAFEPDVPRVPVSRRWFSGWRLASVQCRGLQCRLSGLSRRWIAAQTAVPAQARRCVIAASMLRCRASSAGTTAQRRAQPLQTAG